MRGTAVETGCGMAGVSSADLYSVGRPNHPKPTLAQTNPCLNKHDCHHPCPGAFEANPKPT